MSRAEHDRRAANRGCKPSARSAARTPRLLVRRALFAGFQALATVGMLIRDRQPLRCWPGHLLPCLGHFAERAEQAVWIHGEGMGEFNAAHDLIAALRLQLPEARFVFTASRSATSEWLRARYPDDLALPHTWDVPFAVGRFTRALNPRLIVLLEFHDGFCPGALRWARAAGVPVVVVNARTLHAGRPWRFRVATGLGLVQAAARHIDGFITQDEATAGDLLTLGADAGRISIVGNLKYDFTPPPSAGLRGQFRLPDYAPLLIAGCIHPDEEALIVATFAHLRATHSRLRFLVAPYSLTQVDSLEDRLRRAGLTSRRATDARGDRDASVLVLNTVGTLAATYGMAQMVVLGGSFAPGGGGHSLVEAAAQGKPIVLGPHTASQTPMVRAFLAAEAALQVQPAELAATLERLLREPDLGIAMGERARGVVAQHSGATARTLTALTPFLSPAPQEREQPDEAAADPVSQPRREVTFSLTSAVKALALTPPGQLVLAARSRRLPTLDALHDHLGRPDTILCLGNGPSSEDASLAHVAHDCLFRVNWRWLERGRFRHPDVVFTGDRESLRRCPPCLFGFRTIAEEVSVLLHTFGDRRRGRASYFTIERLPLWVNRDWPARPTNGAVMVAVAAALQPRCLVIAGIDLFGHPAGRYPGAPAANHYAPMHDRDVELAILRESLDRFPGEVRIVSPVLRDALARSAPASGTRRAA